MMAAIWAGLEALSWVAALAPPACFLFGAIGNIRGTGGRHPGGWLMAAAVGLIGLGVAGGLA